MIGEYKYMINITKVREEFEKYLDNYENHDDPGFKLKVVHTYHVVDNAKQISTNMNLSQTDIELAQLIAYFHDIGRFEELRVFKDFVSERNDHALFGSKVLFEGNLLRQFIKDDSYDHIIKKAIENHNKFAIEDGLTDEELLHAKIIRDADKLDNYRVFKTEPIEALFPGKFSSVEEFNNSVISDKVYSDILEHKCIDVHDRVHPLDYWLCILVFVFDINFKETLSIIEKENYVNALIDRFTYNKEDTKSKMENIRNILISYMKNRA